ncbi:MAG: 23S rRNA (guanosine(2251)-2'-O)-methyltransferase RlmB [Treponema sp.]|jgi:23S rRNA (guanosine2251-2'-O)-methyltransferase|nr:23S rRNA (guanosine(2251)-2'-O)-methyltransferase RlmB [Treponema sp.]
MIYVTGFHAIEEKIKSGEVAGSLLVAKAGPRAKKLLDLAHNRTVRVERVGTFDLDRLAPGNRGIVLVIDSDMHDDSGVHVTVEEFIDGLNEEKRTDVLVAVLDEITDPHNYGAILRSCDQFGVDLVITRNRRIAKHADVISKTSAGADVWVAVAEVANLPRAVETLKQASFWIYGADMDGEAVYTMNLSGRVALILGGEGSGISRLLREHCDAFVAIPSRGRIDSLNVSVAAGVLFYEVMRQRLSVSYISNH